MRIKTIILILTIVAISIIYATHNAADSRNSANAKTNATNDRQIVEQSDCGKRIREFFNDVERIWDVTFMYQPKELCIVLKDNIWYDLYDENNILMEQKL